MIRAEYCSLRYMYIIYYGCMRVCECLSCCESSLQPAPCNQTNPLPPHRGSISSKRASLAECSAVYNVHCCIAIVTLRSQRARQKQSAFAVSACNIRGRFRCCPIVSKTAARYTRGACCAGSPSRETLPSSLLLNQSAAALRFWIFSVELPIRYYLYSFGLISVVPLLLVMLL